MRASIYQVLQRDLPDVELQWCDDILNEIKAVKSDNELGIMRQAYKVAEAGMQAAAASLKKGVKEWEVTAQAQCRMLRMGAGNTGFFVNAGPNSLCDFTGSSDYKLRESEIIGIQIGCNYRGYSGAISRPAVIGKVPSEIRSFVDASRRACDRLLTEAKTGALASEVAKAVVKSLADDGYEETFRWGPAHGTGIYECESPFLETTSTYVLKENMTFNIDLYLRNEKMGFRFEDGFRVTADGAEEFCSLPRDLIVAA